MMEEADACECHSDAVLIASLDDIVIANRTTSLCNVLHTTFVSTFNVVTKWEECIGTKTNIGVLGKPCLFLVSL